MPTLYVQVKGSSTTSNQPVPIPGLSLDIPEGTGAQAVIILNAPQAYATGVGGCFQLSVDGTRPLPGLQFVGARQSPLQHDSFVPCTLVGAVPLKLKPQKVQAEFFAAIDGTINSGPASLTIMAD